MLHPRLTLAASHFATSRPDPDHAKPLFVLVSVETVNIFANPIAGKGRGKWTAQRLARRLRADGYAVRTALDRPEHLTEAWTNGEIRAAVIIGGDGTLRTVAARLLAL